MHKVVFSHHFFFSIYTNDLKSCYSDVEVIKYADDTLIIGNIRNDDNVNYFDTIRKSIEWCNENNLSLNESKTKEMIFDFRKKQEAAKESNYQQS